MLPPPDAANLAGSCKSLSKVEGLLKYHKDCFTSQTLTSIPRESRFKAFKDFLANAYPHADVLNNLIAAYGHIPRQYRPQARQAIMKWVKELPKSQTEKLADVGARLNEIASNLESVDTFHDGVTGTEQIGIAQIMNLPHKDQERQFLEKCEYIRRLP